MHGAVTIALTVLSASSAMAVCKPNRIDASSYARSGANTWAHHSGSATSAQVQSAAPVVHSASSAPAVIATSAPVDDSDSTSDALVSEAAGTIAPFGNTDTVADASASTDAVSSADEDKLALSSHQTRQSSTQKAATSTQSYTSAAAAATSTAATVVAAASSGNGNVDMPSRTNGTQCKAGTAGGDSLKWLQNDLCWFYDWSPNPGNGNSKELQTAPMLWGLGLTSDPVDATRFAAFKALNGTYKYVLGFNEPDFAGDGSSGVMTPAAAAAGWDTYIGKYDGSARLISPSCAKQADETFLAPFIQDTKSKPDIIAIHMFVDNVAMMNTVFDHYKTNYTQNFWITEFACINYQGATPATCDQAKTNTMIDAMVQLFEQEPRVAAYAYSDTTSHGQYGTLSNGSGLTDTGKAYQKSIWTWRNTVASSQSKRSDAKRSPEYPLGRMLGRHH